MAVLSARMPAAVKGAAEPQYLPCEARPRARRRNQPLIP